VVVSTALIDFLVAISSPPLKLYKKPRNARRDEQYTHKADEPRGYEAQKQKDQPCDQQHASQCLFAHNRSTPPLQYYMLREVLF